MFKKILKTPKYLLLVFLSLVIIFLFFLSQKNRSSVSETTSFFPSLPKIKIPTFKSDYNQLILSSFTFAGNFPSFPEKLPVFTANPPPEVITLCQQIADSLKIEKKPFAENFRTNLSRWENQNYYLICNPSSNSFLFSRPVTVNKKKPSFDPALKATNDFLPLLGLDPLDFELEENKITYFKTLGGENIPTEKDQANIFQFHFQKKIDTWPIWQPHVNQFPLTVTISFENFVSKVSYSPLAQRIKKGKNYSLAGISEILLKINQSQGTITQLVYSSEEIHTSPSELVANDVTQISFGKLRQVEIVYLFSSKNKLYLPGYLFQGIGTAQNGKAVNFSLIIPAIIQEYFESE
ncbi:hypothetical protein ACFLZP_00185 [Patescibacteria group bacterium]